MRNPITFTNAYKMIAADKRSGSLSHAYLITCADESMIESYLLELAKLVACDGSNTPSDKRVADLIDKKIHPDVGFYPKEKKLSVDNLDEIVAQSVVKPMELNIRLFVLCKFEELNQYQNKLLKTLEEPPANVIILMGTANENAVLPTVRSRSKILNVPLFSDEQLFKALSEDFTDRKKLALAVTLSGGRYGEAIRYAEAPFTESLHAYCYDLLGKMNKAGDVLGYASKMNEFLLKDVISVLKVVCGKAIEGAEGYENLSEKYRKAVFISITDRLNKLEKALNFNGNTNMVTDGILFAVMEEKARWQKLSV